MSSPATTGIVDTAIRDRAERQRRQRVSLLADWRLRQKPGIEAKRGSIVAAFCEMTAQQVADFFAWSPNPFAVVLTAAQIEKCQERAISQERARAYGPIPEDGELYKTQWENARSAVLAGKRLKRLSDREEPETMEELRERMKRDHDRAAAFHRDFEKGADGRYRYRTEPLSRETFDPVDDGAPGQR